MFSGLRIQAAADEIIISEFVAANISGLHDEDGDLSNWIELYNPNSSSVSLAGWHLTDDPKNLTLWKFPAVSISAEGYLIVFASGKNRINTQTNLHTNFKLSRQGEFLALVHPDGVTVASSFSPNYPLQKAGVAYGRSVNIKTNVLVGAEADGRMLVPANSSLNQLWMQPDYDDAAWNVIPMGVGYHRAQDPDNEPAAVGTDVTVPGDKLVATSSNSPGNEGVTNVIDNDPHTKYLNFDKLNAGFVVTPSAGLSIVTGLRLTSANDAVERDPASYVLFGSNDGQSYSLISSNSVPAFSNRFASLTLSFPNATAYRHYRLLFPTVVNASAAVAMQIADVEFLGQLGSEIRRFDDLIQSNVETALYGRAASAYLRFPFNAPADLVSGRLLLHVRYDDGFVAFLNGVEIARANAPATLGYQSMAVTNRYRSQAVFEETINISRWADRIHEGKNVLAIQGLRQNAYSSSFLLAARLENSVLSWRENAYFAVPTPGEVNGPGAMGLVSDLGLNPGSGFFETPTNVAIYCPTEAVTIYFTTNGSLPSATNGFAYTGPIPVTGTTVLRAAAFRDGWLPSTPVTQTYLFLNDVVAQSQASALAAGFPAKWDTQAAEYGMDTRVVGPADKYGGKYARSIKSDLQSLPSLSIVMDVEDLFGTRGIYSQPTSHGEDWERAAAIELIHPDGSKGFRKDAGIRIQGGAFRRFDLTLKKSFRLIFRNEYSEDWLKYAWFGTNAASEFNNVILRANSNDAWPYAGGSAVYVRDAFAAESLRAMGQAASHGTYVHLYLNGLYWGLYNPIERPDAAFSATYHGGKRDSWDAINQDSVPDGTADAWNRLLNLLNQDMTQTANYQRIQGNNADGTPQPSYEHLIEIDNLIDYLILNFYIGNTDWPGRNWWVGRNRDTGEGFYFYPWDSETALDFSGLNANVLNVNSAVARPYGALRNNADFKMRLADRIYQHFFNDGPLYVNPAQPKWEPAHPENNRPAARFAALADSVRNAMVGESARWGRQLHETGTPYTRDEHWQKAYTNVVANYFPQRSAIVMEQFRQAGLYPKTSAPGMIPRGGQLPQGVNITLSADQGTIYYTTNGGDPRVLMLAKNTNAVLVYAGPFPLSDLTTVKARVLNGQEWSALNQATFTVGNPLLRITELHYHSAAPSAAEISAGFTDNSDFEFIELRNSGNATCPLAGVHFTQGITFDFTASPIAQLSAGQYLLLVKNRAAFEYRYGQGLPIAGEYGGKLDNAGERIELADAVGTVLLSFVFDTQSSWLLAADGAGPSLEVIDPQGDLNNPANWRASSAAGGSPGIANPEPAPGLQLQALEPGRIRLRFERNATMGYTVYGRASLSSGNWQVYQKGDPTPGNPAVTVDLMTSTNAEYYYRVSVP